MLEPSFNHLVALLKLKVSMDKLQAFLNPRGNDPINPETVIGAGLQFFVTR